MAQGIKSYFKEIWLELKRVNWLTRKESIKYTFIVIGFSIGIAIILGVLDFVFNFIIERLLIR